MRVELSLGRKAGGLIVKAPVVASWSSFNFLRHEQGLWLVLGTSLFSVMDIVNVE